MKKINLLVMLILIAALAAAGFLAKNSQETRRGASYASVEALFLPSVKNVSVGDRVVTTLMIDAKSHFLTGADIRVKFDSSKLELEKAEVLVKDNFLGGVPWLQSVDEVLISEIDNQKGTYSLVGTNIQNEVANLPTGVINVVKLHFGVKAVGQAEVSMDKTYGNIITGYNVGGADQELGIEKVSFAVYTISEGVAVTTPISLPPTSKCGWCGTNCVDFNKKGEDIACAMIYVVGKTCVDDGGSCVIKTSAEMKAPAVSE